MESAHWRIVEDDLSGHDIRTLLEIHFAGMRANSPVGSCHFLDFEGLKADNVTFWSIWDGHDLAGCGALKQLDDTHGELKSMRTAEAHLGRRVGARMLTHILEDARARSYTRVSLETGSGEPFAAAVRLYTNFGFEPCGPFGDYTDDPFSRYFMLSL
jgi:putative acetyltransferase